MRAIVLTRYGPPDLLELKDVAKPEPKADELLVRVRATAINDWDWAYVRGRPYLYRLFFGLRKPRTHVLGTELAGIVEAIGSAVSHFQPGDEVYGDVSEAGFGAFADYTCVREDALARKPAAMTFEQAACVPHAAMLAYQGLVSIGDIQPRERVLINGAGGGVGMIGVQIAQRYDAEVTGVDSAIKLDAMRTLGFDRVIDYAREDFTASGERYDLILDAKSTRSPFRYLHALRKGGRYVTVGGHLPRLLQILAAAPFVSRFSDKSLHIVALKPNRDLAAINELFELRGLQFVIDGPYPLDQVPLALQRFGEAKHVGKLVITVAAD